MAEKRVALDYNKVLTEDGRWAGRLVVAPEENDSYLRALNNKHTAFSGIVRRTDRRQRHPRTWADLPGRRTHARPCGAR